MQNFNHVLARCWLVLGCASAAMAVALGAAGAHALKARLIAANTQQWFETALQYHQMHALGLLLVGVLALWRPKQKLVHISGAFMLVGMVLFCGLLYLRSLSDVLAWHGLIPMGGAALITSWVLLGIAAWKLPDA
jgi:uncharacterized membrane protein YgdD (TMEM256/DUF423 family)